jgi:hypothetical protein
MALRELVAKLDSARFLPRTLELKIPADLSSNLSPEARFFIGIAIEQPTTPYSLTDSAWTSDPDAKSFFEKCDEDVQLEILGFITLFVHENTHRIDFLISPFGLQYYTTLIREYWCLQEFLPELLDDPDTVNQVRFLAGLGEKAVTTPDNSRLKRLWDHLRPLVHTSYAWGDLGTTKPLGKYIESGWGRDLEGVGDPFGLGLRLEFVTVLSFFHTFRIPEEKLWYLRPLTIFETKAVVNTLLFIMRVGGDLGPKLCDLYFRKFYEEKRTELPRDYFLLLDLGARFYDQPSFAELLSTRQSELLRSVLLLVSTGCWYALQAPPVREGQDDRIGNPILRLWCAFMFLKDVARGRAGTDGEPTAVSLLRLEKSKMAKQLFQASISTALDNCSAVIRQVADLNRERTWNPEVRGHFEHIFKLMRPHFETRERSYVSPLGMPDHGNPFSGCRGPADWELTYDDYVVPSAVTDWFGIRSDLLFNLLAPPAAVIERLDRHFMALLVPLVCSCGAMTTQWHSRFAAMIESKCGKCGSVRRIPREAMTAIRVPTAKE